MTFDGSLACYRRSTLVHRFVEPAALLSVSRKPHLPGLHRSEPHRSCVAYHLFDCDQVNTPHCPLDSNTTTVPRRYQFHRYRITMSQQPQEQCEQTLSWMGCFTDDAVCNPQDTLISPTIEVEGTQVGGEPWTSNAPPPTLAFNGNQSSEAELEAAIEAILATDDNANVQQTPFPAPFNPVQQLSYRPQLQLATSAASLAPCNPTYPPTLPNSAPAPTICIHGPEHAHHQRVATPPVGSTRRPRAATGPAYHPPPLQHYNSAPAISPVSPSEYLSPQMAQFLISEDPLPHLQHAQQQAPPATEDASPRSARSRERSRSLSRSRSYSRNSSIASSAKSSASGEFNCDFAGCGKSYPKKSTLKHHQRCHTPYDQRKHVCDQCGARFLYPRELERHKQNITHQEPQYVCSVCGKPFGRPDHLERHMKGHPRSRSVGPATPMPSDSPYSAPSAAGSLSSRGPRTQASASSMNSGSALTDWSSPPQFDKSQFPPLPSQATADVEMEDDPFMDTLPAWARPFPSDNPRR